MRLKLPDTAQNQRDNPGLISIRFSLYILFLFIVLGIAWQSDDAYHAYVMAKHLAEGYGFVYNIGERVSTTTCPFFTIIIAAAYALTHEMYLTSLLVCILFTAAAMYLLFWKFCCNKLQVIIAFLLCCDKSFMMFTTSGLENSMLFFLVAVFLHFSSKEIYTFPNMLKIAILAAIIAGTRMDNILIFLPFLFWLFFIHQNKIGRVKSCFTGLLGITPFLCWEVFSIFYYGFPFPNTAYSKLNTGISLAQYIRKGFEYYYATFVVDPGVILIPLIGIICSWTIFKTKRAKLYSVGILLYMLYVICIGGDFMSGRHFTVIYFLTVCTMVKSSRILNEMQLVKMKTPALFLSMAFFAYTSSVGRLFGMQFQWSGKYMTKAQVADEQAFYFPHTSLLNNVYSYITGGSLDIRNSWDFLEVNAVRDQGMTRSILNWAPGILVYYNSDMYLGDRFGLGDPLLTRLNSDPVEGDYFRTGHIARYIPEGYTESVENNDNEITDPSLHEYFDKLLFITRGDLYDLNRIKTIIKMNIGAYEYLLEQYIQKIKY